MKYRLVHPFLYVRLLDKKTRRFEVRDQSAMFELLRVLCKGSTALGQQVFNVPPDQPPLHIPQDLLQLDLTRYGPKDLLVAVTRPPVDDELQMPKKVVARGYTNLEEYLFGIWRTYFASCSRVRIDLQRNLWPLLPEWAVHLAHMEFYQYSRCSFKKLKGGIGGWRKTPENPNSIGFILRVENLWKGGPGLLWAFGMNRRATETLCRRLATTHKGMLNHVGLTMVHLECRPCPERSPDLAWAEGGQFETVFQIDGPRIWEPPVQAGPVLSRIATTPTAPKQKPPSKAPTKPPRRTSKNKRKRKEG